MAYNTNGWDFIYTMTIEKLNKILEEISVLTLNNISVTNGINTIVFTSNPLGKVLSSSNYPELHLEMKLSGKINGTIDFKDLKAIVKINVDWLNRNDGSVNSTQDIYLDKVTEWGGLLTTANQNKFTPVFTRFINEKFNTGLQDVTTIATPRTTHYHSYHSFFLNAYDLENGGIDIYIKPKVNRFSIKSNVHLKPSDVTCFFSFSCMKSNGNNDIGYVDVNVVDTDKENSSLVLDRKFFLKNLVDIINPKIAGDFAEPVTPEPVTPEPVKPDNKPQLVKNDSYSYSNDVKCTLKSKDYKDVSGTPVQGSVDTKRLTLKAEESNLVLSLTDVVYKFNSNNNPTINQEYIFNLKWGVKDSKPTVIVDSTEKLFIISNNFKPNIFWDYFLNIGIPATKHLIIKNWFTSIIEANKNIQPFEYYKLEKKKEMIKLTQIAPEPVPTKRLNPSTDSFSKIIKESEMENFSNRGGVQSIKENADESRAYLNKSFSYDEGNGGGISNEQRAEAQKFSEQSDPFVKHPQYKNQVKRKPDYSKVYAMDKSSLYVFQFLDKVEKLHDSSKIKLINIEWTLKRVEERKKELNNLDKIAVQMYKERVQSSHDYLKLVLDFYKINKLHYDENFAREYQIYLFDKNRMTIVKFYAWGEDIYWGEHSPTFYDATSRDDFWLNENEDVFNNYFKSLSGNRNILVDAFNRNKEHLSINRKHKVDGSVRQYNLKLSNINEIFNETGKKLNEILDS